MVEVISLIVSALALGVALAAFFPTRRSAEASERSAGAAERAELAAVKAADRAAKVQLEQATRDAYRATLVEFRNAADDLRGTSYGAAIIFGMDDESGDLARRAQVEIERQADALGKVHAQVGPELGGALARAMEDVMRSAAGMVISTIPPTRTEGWQQRRRQAHFDAYEAFIARLDVFREAHHAYLTPDLTESP
ncbi:hypothetical protein J3A78_003893 [Streptomyces sp. PvR006]|uniref:hypothetical protein n=1 Tax=Streptomyces sp. PvR006 TaxID=2817860 RepID=UPI001AE47CF2|nr:hypothetical protein [Streptomyces sp. PvR006]MBP2583415.1 hypothetical protein [Streptomyces sp. PvR006]